MCFGSSAVPVAAAMVSQAHAQMRPKWSTRMSQCDEPSKCEDWAFSFVCLPCANAVAKTEADKSNVCYNFLCWSNPVGTYSYIRHIYSLPGSCGDDCGYGIFCMPCSVRQVYTESRLRKVPVHYAMAGTKREEWHVSLFDCNCCQFFNAIFCAPCMAGEIRGQLQPTAAPDCCFNTFCIIPTAVYGQTRHEFGLITDCEPMEDLCVPLFCFPCALSRAQNEIRWQMSSGGARLAVAAAGAVAGPAGAMVAGAIAGGSSNHGPPSQPMGYPQHGAQHQQQGYAHHPQQGGPQGYPPPQNPNYR